MKIKIFILLFFAVNTSFSQNKITAEQYIEKFYTIAVKEMYIYGIPASITLAQGLLETNNGSSSLCTIANNHFGIKCKEMWTGKKYYYDDDAPQECFRHYDNAFSSYRDHSEFLKTRKHYNFLFNYSNTDYINWAKGLKKAGYATNLKYPETLIYLIKKYDLSKYDYYKENDLPASKLDEIAYLYPNNREKTNDVVLNNIATNDIAYNNINSNKKLEKENSNIYLYNNNNNKEKIINRYKTTTIKCSSKKYILANEGESLETIAIKNAISINELCEYNDLTYTSSLLENQIIYLEPKRKKAERFYKTHTALQGEDLYFISQIYGIKMSSLYKKNDIDLSNKLRFGQVIKLR